MDTAAFRTAALAPHLSHGDQVQSSVRERAAPRRFIAIPQLPRPAGLEDAPEPVIREHIGSRSTPPRTTGRTRHCARDALPSTRAGTRKSATPRVGNAFAANSCAERTRHPLPVAPRQHGERRFCDTRAALRSEASSVAGRSGSISGCCRPGQWPGDTSSLGRSPRSVGTLQSGCEQHSCRHPPMSGVTTAARYGSLARCFESGERLRL
jgi:hypothetical protein